MNANTWRRAAAFLIGGVITFSCVGSAAPEPDATGTAAAIARANTGFGLALYSKINDSSRNVIFSPLGISTALAMTAAGARGPTEAEMLKALQLTGSAEQLGAGFAALGKTLRFGVNKEVTFQLANALWSTESIKPKEAFLELLRKDYAAEARCIEFFPRRAEAAEAINRWVAEHTANKISHAFDQNTFTRDTSLVLCNAIYFKGTWADPFEPQDTEPGPFFILSGQKIQTPEMHQLHGFRVLKIPDARLIDLPYAEGRFSMVVLLPNEPTGLAKLEQALDPVTLSGWLNDLHARNTVEVKLTLPKFTHSSSHTLKPALEQLGIKTAFVRGSADFPVAYSARDYALSAVDQMVKIEVSEEGTVATAAAESVELATFAVTSRELPIDFKVDHSFLFLIRENATGTILFLGHIVDPTQG